MVDIVSKVKVELERNNDSESQFYCDYKKTEKMYQELIDKGLTSRRESQLLSVTDKMAMIAKRFSRNSKSSTAYSKPLFGIG